jgi:hypothetical protein
MQLQIIQSSAERLYRCSSLQNFGEQLLLQHRMYNYLANVCSTVCLRILGDGQSLLFMAARAVLVHLW